MTRLKENPILTGPLDQPRRRSAFFFPSTNAHHRLEWRRPRRRRNRDGDGGSGGGRGQGGGGAEATAASAVGGGGEGNEGGDGGRRRRKKQWTASATAAEKERRKTWVTALVGKNQGEVLRFSGGGGKGGAGVGNEDGDLRRRGGNGRRTVEEREAAWTPGRQRQNRSGHGSWWREFGRQRVGKKQRWAVATTGEEISGEVGEKEEGRGVAWTYGNHGRRRRGKKRRGAAGGGFWETARRREWSWDLVCRSGRWSGR